MSVGHHRLIWIVLDSVGIGAAPDASLYGEPDQQSNTLLHAAEAVSGLSVPNLERMGLGNLLNVPGVKPSLEASVVTRMQEQSYGKDTTNGHWEFVGVILDRPLPTYPHGFPSEVIQAFEGAIGRGILCNRPASGTEVIQEYGEEHLQSGKPIIYTSADSVFQIAVHEEIVPVETLYQWCEEARRILSGEHGVGRVIARPFVGQPGHFVRTHHRKDFSLTFGENVLSALTAKGIPVCGIGKISDIYGGVGITASIHTENNEDGMNQVLYQMGKQFDGVIYANLVDFDALYGHRNDAVGFARAIEAFDARLGLVLAELRDDDVLWITADHGCDPTTPGTDHTREWVPWLMRANALTTPVRLPDRHTFADMGATLAELFAIPMPPAGRSILPELVQQGLRL
jgi:phosphopentomutase